MEECIQGSSPVVSSKQTEGLLVILNQLYQILQVIRLFLQLIGDFLNQTNHLKLKIFFGFFKLALSLKAVEYYNKKVFSVVVVQI